MVTAYISLGSNLGDRLTFLRAAMRALAGSAGISIDVARDVASLYETTPVGGPPDQGTFLNSVARVYTHLAPAEFLDVLLSVEGDLGRQRGARWGPRCIDLDLLLYADVVARTARLTLPHPRLHRRRFVLEPLCELAATVVHPKLSIPIAELAASASLSLSEERVIRVMHPFWAGIGVDSVLGTQFAGTSAVSTRAVSGE